MEKSIKICSRSRMILVALMIVVISLMVTVDAKAQQGKKLYTIQGIDSETYRFWGGFVWTSYSHYSDDYTIEGRVLVQNTTDEYVNYQTAKIVFFDASYQICAEVPAVVVNPKSVQPGGFAVFTFSQPDVKIKSDNDLIVIFGCKPQIVEEREQFLGMDYGYLKPNQYTDGVFMRMDLSALPEGVYLVNLIAIDDEGYFVWADDCSINTAYETTVSAPLADYELEMLDELELYPDEIIGFIYEK